MDKKYYVHPSFDDIDLAPVWEVRKKSFLFFSCLVCEFSHKHKARKLAIRLNREQGNG